MALSGRSDPCSPIVPTVGVVWPRNSRTSETTPPSKTTVRRLTDGVELEDGRAVAVSARIVDRSSETTMIELVMTEGRNREIRRMCDAIGHPVLRLVRTAIGPLSDRSLRPGSVRLLTSGEVSELYRAAGRVEPPPDPAS